MAASEETLQNPTLEASHPAKLLFKSSILDIIDYRCKGGDQRQEEFSTDHEIVLPRSGAYIRRDSLGTFLADPNQVIFFNREQPYEINHPYPGEDHSTVFILAPSLLFEMIKIFNANVEGHPTKPFQTSHQVIDSRLRLLQYWLLRISWETRHAEPLEIEEKIISLLFQILAEHFNTLGCGTTFTKAPVQGNHNDLTNQVRLFLSKNIHNPIQLEQISSAVFTSPYHLSRVFKKSTGISIHKYLIRLRLLNAVEQLVEDRKHEIDEMALEFGFSSHSHFSTAFQQVFGMSPSVFRKTINTATFRQLSKILKV